jgi:hypothetical protein
MDTEGVTNKLERILLQVEGAEKKTQEAEVITLTAVVIAFNIISNLLDIRLHSEGKIFEIVTQKSLKNIH